MRIIFSDRSDMIWLALVPGLLHFLSFDFNYFLISGFPSWSAWGWLGWSSGVAFVVARGVAVVVVGGWLSWSPGGWLSWSSGVAFVVARGGFRRRRGGGFRRPWEGAGHPASHPPKCLQN